MKSMMFLALTLLTCACGQAQGSYPEEFTPYVVAFKEQAEAHGRHIPDDYLKGLDIHYGNATEACGAPSIGCCTVFHRGLRQVIVDQTLYSKLPSDSERTELFFHEFGHCLLDQMQHRDGKNVDREPASVMHSSLFAGDYFRTHFEDYMEELFDFQ